MERFAIVLASIAVACSSSTTTPRPLAQTSDAGPDASTASTDEARKACEERCAGIVRGRHDACGRRAGPPWPQWCADSNEDMRNNCEASCR